MAAKNKMAAKIKVAPKLNGVKTKEGKTTVKAIPVTIRSTQPYNNADAGTFSNYHGERQHVSHDRSGPLSAVARDYLMALADPADAPLTGIPTEWPLVESFKIRSYTKGTLAIGTNRIGFIQALPHNSMASDGSAVVYSLNTYTLTTTPVTYAEIGVTAAAANAPFTTSSYGTAPNLLQGRVVGSMLRVWYIGTELNVSGETYAVRQPDNLNMSGGFSGGQIMGFPGALRSPVTSQRKSVEVFYLPVQAADVQYGVPSPNDPRNITIMVAGVPGELFAYEFYAMHEIIGSNVPSVSRTAGDPVGLTAAIESAESSNSTYLGSAASLAKSLIKNAGEALTWMSDATGVSVNDAARGSARLGAKYLMGRYMQSLAEYRALEPAHKERHDLLNLTGYEFDVKIGQIYWEEFLQRRDIGDLIVQTYEPYIIFKNRDGKDRIAMVERPIAPLSNWKSNFKISTLKSHKPKLMASGYIPPLEVENPVLRAGVFDLIRLVQKMN